MMKMIQKWIWLVVAIPYFIVYSKKTGGFGQILSDLETYTFDKLKTKVGNIVFMIVAGIILWAVMKAKMPVAAKVIIMGIMYFVFGYNLFKAIDDPRGTSTGSVAVQSSYFGRNRSFGGV
jgi:hypothetical protein